MAVGVRMKRGTVHKPFDRKRNTSIVDGKRRGGRYEMEDSDGEVFNRVDELDRFSNSSKKGRNLRPNPKQSSRGFERGEEDDSGLSRPRMRKAYPSKNAGNERKYLVRGQKELDKDVDFARKSKSSDGRFLREKPRPNPKRSSMGFERGEEDDSRLSHPRMRKAYPSKNAGNERKYSVRGRKEWDKDVDFARKSKFSDGRFLREKPRKAIQRVVDADFSDYDQTSRGYHRSKERNGKTETTAEKVRCKRRKVDGEFAKSRHDDDAEEEELEKHGVSKDGKNQNSEQKYVRRPTRVMDKTGKMIRVEYKHLKNSSTETSASKKRTKRVIKIDPYDISNKRLVDVLKSEIVVAKDIAVEKDTAQEKDTAAENENMISMNAQFRVIQPSDEILASVEDNLLGRRRLIEFQNAGYNVKLSAPLDNIPFSTSINREKMEDNVFRNKLEFFAAAKISSSFPPPTLPEIAFAGRSNVGKSSLLNSLTRQWGVVRTSDKPGLTQTINFFKLASKLCLVDLPGYGFAYAKEEVKEAWEDLVKEFVSTRVGLQRVCLLVDTKWGMKVRDFELIDLMERSKTPYQIILTKTDLVFPIDVARRAMQIQANLKKNELVVEPVVMVSSKSGAGIRNLRSVLAKIARFVKP